MLTGMCDAVALLSSDFSVIGPARELCSLLLLPTHIQMSRKVHEYMTTEDSERFRSHLVSASKSEGSFLKLPPHPLHITLRDASASSIPVVVYSASIADLDGTWRHIIGIK